MIESQTLTAIVDAGVPYRARIVAIDDDGVHISARDPNDETTFPCDVLLIEPATLAVMSVGDEVLAVSPTGTSTRGVVLGRIGCPGTQRVRITALDADAQDAPTSANEPVDSLVLEAKEELILRVGDGSITIRKDGKILIKGKDLVSNAQRMNRIKGGAVSIN
jgi:hypothetical protein